MFRHAIYTCPSRCSLFVLESRSNVKLRGGLPPCGRDKERRVETGWRETRETRRGGGRTRGWGGRTRQRIAVDDDNVRPWALYRRVDVFLSCARTTICSTQRVNYWQSSRGWRKRRYLTIAAVLWTYYSQHVNNNKSHSLNWTSYSFVYNLCA